MNLTRLIQERLKETEQVKRKLRQACSKDLEKAARACISALKRGKSIYIFGNGGSAADAQHFQGELQGKFYVWKKALPVIAFTTNASVLTAISNDIGFKYTFERQVEGHAKRGDIVIAISTSGNSENVTRAAKKARALGAIVIGLTGQKGGKLLSLSNIIIRAPSNDVARIQECHTTICHIMCEAIKRSV